MERSLYQQLRWVWPLTIVCKRRELTLTPSNMTGSSSDVTGMSGAGGYFGREQLWSEDIIMDCVLTQSQEFYHTVQWWLRCGHMVCGLGLGNVICGLGLGNVVCACGLGLPWECGLGLGNVVCGLGLPWVCGLGLGNVVCACGLGLGNVLVGWDFLGNVVYGLGLGNVMCGLGLGDFGMGCLNSCSTCTNGGPGGLYVHIQAGLNMDPVLLLLKSNELTFSCLQYYINLL